MRRGRRAETKRPGGGGAEEGELTGRERRRRRRKARKRGKRGRERDCQGKGGRERVDEKLERNSNFRPHFSSSINSYLYATPCFLSIRARSSLPEPGLPEISRQICQSVLRHTDRGIGRPDAVRTQRNCQSCEYSSL